MLVVRGYSQLILIKINGIQVVLISQEQKLMDSSTKVYFLWVG